MVCWFKLVNLLCAVAEWTVGTLVGIAVFTHMLLLRLVCSGAATALPAAPRVCAYCPALSRRLSATMVALLLLPAQPRLCNNTAGHVSTARQLTMEADPDARKSLQLRGSVLPDAGSPFALCDAPFARCGPTWTAYNGTSAACHFAGPVAAVLSPTTEPNSVLDGMDFLFMILEKLWDGVSRDFVRILRAAVTRDSRMELCSFEHRLRVVHLASNLCPTTSPSMFLCLNYILVTLGVLSGKVSAGRARFASVFGALICWIFMVTYLMVDIIELSESNVLVPYFLVLFVQSIGKMVLYKSNMMMLYVYSKVMYFCKMLSSGRGSGVYSSTRGIVMLVLLGLPSIQAVCPTCKGAVDGCAGGAACPWLTTVAANAAAVLVTATAGFISAKALLPPGLLQAFPRSVLDTILLLARIPAA